jgi:hypothetical protein
MISIQLIYGWQIKMKQTKEYLERSIIIGLIVSTEYLEHLRPDWDAKLLESSTAQTIAFWCIEYFDEFNEAPGKHIQDIYMDKLHKGDLPEDLAEDMEQTLEGLSDEYEMKFNLKYVLAKTNTYFQEKRLEKHSERIKELTEAGELDEAERLAGSYAAGNSEISQDIDLSDSKALLRVENAFNELSEPILTYPGALGEFWNDQLVRGAFVGLLAPEKRGKSFWLLDMAFRASKQKARVAFFQAGDMTEAQQLRRMCVYRAQRSDKQRYCGEMYLPVVDCVRNQLDTCTKSERECSWGPFGDVSKWDEKTIRQEIRREQLIEAFEDDPTYMPCRNCEEFRKRPLGIPWVRKVNIKNPLNTAQAVKEIKEFFVDKKRHFILSTHESGTLSTDTMNAKLDEWERKYGFIADLIVVDYGDLMTTHKERDFRHKQNQIWKELRSLNQRRNCLLIVPSQADADSYDAKTLKKRNFSEDKRKYAHPTAWYGLNQDPDKREKRLGIMRLNNLMIREGDEELLPEVTVLQSLSQGRPFIGSYK